MPEPQRAPSSDLDRIVFERWVESGDTSPLSRRFAFAATQVGSEEGTEVSEPMHRAIRWRTMLHDYEEFWRQASHAPRENTRDRTQLPAAERRLGRWARTQRDRRSSLTGYQLVRLDASPAFEWDMQDGHWNRQYEAVLQMRIHHGRFPVRAAHDPTENALARWFNRQLTHMATGSLTAVRRERIEELLARFR
jgi:hypothetical protein